MHIKSIILSNFRGIESANVEFTPGLNVLYGANELGKSSLVAAIRAALLLPPTSSEAKDYKPWGTDLTPKVILTFEADDTTYRVTKEFASGTRGAATLDRMKGNEAYNVKKGRAVDGELRKLLEWGIPEPGGRGAPKGLPSSYLTNALLGEQDDVESILSASIDSDRMESGKNLLTEAVGALGQEPVVTSLIQTLNDRTSRVFTPSGQLKRTQDSPLTKKTREIDNHETRTRRLELALQESERVESTLESLTDTAEEANKKHIRGKRLVELARKAVAAEEQRTLANSQDNSLEAARNQYDQLQRAATEAKGEFRTAKANVERIEREHRKVEKDLATAETTRKNHEESSARSRDERSASIKAQLDSIEKTIEKAKSVLAAEKEARESQTALQFATTEANNAKPAVILATRQLDYSILLEKSKRLESDNQAILKAKSTLVETEERVSGTTAKITTLRGLVTRAHQALQTRQELEEVEKHESKVNEKRQHRDAITQQLIQENANHAKAANERSELGEAVERARNDHATLIGKRETLTTSADSLRESRQRELKSKSESANQKIIQANDVLAARQHLKTQTARLNQLKIDESSVAEQLSLARRICEHATACAERDTAREQQAKITEAQNQRHAAEKEYKRVEHQLANVEQERTAASTELRELKRKAVSSNSIQSKLIQLQAAKLKAESAKQKASNKIESLTRISNLAKQHKSSKSQIATLVKDQSSLDASITELKTSIGAQRKTAKRSQGLSLGSGVVGITIACVAILLSLPGLVAGIAAIAGVSVAFFLFVGSRNVRQQLDDLQSRLASAEDSRQDVKTKCTVLESQIQSAVTDFRASVDALGEDPKAAHHQASNELANAKRQLAELADQETQLNDQVTENDLATPEAIDEAENVLRSSEANVRKTQRSLDAAVAQLNAARSTLTSLGTSEAVDLEAHDSRVSDLAVGLLQEELCMDVPQSATALDKMTQKLEQAKSKRLAAKNEVEAAQERFDTLSTQLQHPPDIVLQESKAEQHQAESDLETIDDAHPKQVQELDAKISTAKNDLDKFQDSLGEAEAKLRVAEVAVKRTQALKDRADGEVRQLEEGRPYDSAGKREQLTTQLAELNQGREGSPIDADTIASAVATLEEDRANAQTQLEIDRDANATAKAEHSQLESQGINASVQDIETRIASLLSIDGPKLNDISVHEAEPLEATASEAQQTASTNLKVARKQCDEKISRYESLKNSFDKSADLVLSDSEQKKKELTSDLNNLNQTLEDGLSKVLGTIKTATESAAKLKEQIKAAKEVFDAGEEKHESAKNAASQAQGKLSELGRSANPSSIAAAQETLKVAVEESQGALTSETPFLEQLEQLESQLKAVADDAKAKNKELQMARGQLDLIGGSVVRDQLDRERETLNRLNEEATDYEQECRAERYLLDILGEVNEQHAAHLGRMLADPVSKKFHDLTGRRYGRFLIEPTLAMRSVEADGGDRSHTSLSVGTRHQLAVLTRLALAAHLRTTLLLDDQLVQSDPVRLEWFRKQIYNSVTEYGHQVIVVTCRPRDYFGEQANGQIGDGNQPLNIIDLQTVITCSNL